jgi:formamidase
MRELVIAALQTAPVAGDVAATFKRTADQVRAVRSTFPDVQLVLLPELHLSAVERLLDEPDGYADEVAVPIPGPLTDQLGALARESGLWLVPGSVYERAGDLVHNTAVVLSPKGELVTTYRKCFPWRPYERTAPGDRFVVFDIPGVGRIGLAICYDLHFPETVRQLAWLGAEVVVQLSLTPTRDRDLELVLARANAITNQVYVVSVNAAAPHAVGQSVVVDPEGLVRQQAGATEEIVVDALDLDAVRRVRRYGTLGLNRMWDLMDEHGPQVDLPMYGGRTYRPRPGRGDPRR